MEWIRTITRLRAWRHACRGCAAVLCLATLHACGKPSPPAADHDSVLVLAAASVGDAVEEVAREFTASTGIEVRVSAAGSNVLAQQIRAGAPGDLFLSADEAWADEVIQSGEGTEKVDLLGNALVLVVPMGNPARIRVPHDLAQKHVTKIALAGEAVPAGRYAQQALRSIGMWPVVERKVVRSENVRAALAYVESGEADAGVVYATDAHSTAKVTVVYKFTPATHDPIVYPLVTLKAGANREAVRDFRRYLQGLEAGAIFSRLGFRVLPHDLPSDAPPGGNEP